MAGKAIKKTAGAKKAAGAKKTASSRRSAPSRREQEESVELEVTLDGEPQTVTLSRSFRAPTEVIFARNVVTVACRPLTSSIRKRTKR